MVTLGLDEELADGGVVSKIERNRVDISYDSGKVATLILEADSTAEKSPKPSRKDDSEQERSRIDNLGDNRWRIPSLVADQARGNVGDLLKQARAVPVLESGQTTGFKIMMIKPRSFIAELGLRRGDVLKNVNGLALDSPEKALQIFAQLRQAKQIQIGLERKGEPMTFLYEIR